MDTTLLLPLLTAAVTGFLHALEPDHMAAVTTFVSRRPHPARAIGFGLRWGVGHSASVLAIGAVLLALDLRIPQSATQGMEFAVGAMLVLLGTALLWSIIRKPVSHLSGAAAMAEPGAERAGRGTLWVGMAHGLAGTAPLLALLPVALIPSTPLVLLYLVLFGVGTIAGMVLYALCVGLLLSRAGAHLPRIGTLLRFSTALGSGAIGVLWMVSAGRPG